MPVRRRFVPACGGLEARLSLSGLQHHVAALQSHFHAANAAQHGHSNGKHGQQQHGQQQRGQHGHVHGTGMVHTNILPFPYSGGGGSGSGGTGGGSGSGGTGGTGG